MLFFVLGCSGQDKGALEREESNIKPLAILYSKYVAAHRRQPPPDEEAFREYILSLPENQRKQFHADDLDAFFVSPRDNKPYVVMYGATRRGRSDVVAYEQEGEGGKRWVARDLGIVEEVDEARFKELVPDGS
jgi:hypothetical protein